MNETQGVPTIRVDTYDNRGNPTPINFEVLRGYVKVQAGNQPLYMSAAELEELGYAATLAAAHVRNDETTA